MATMALLPARSAVASEGGCHTSRSALGFTRYLDIVLHSGNRKFADSLLEGSGFELSVPHETGSGFETSSEFGPIDCWCGGIIRAVVGLGKTNRAFSAARGAHSPPN